MHASSMREMRAFSQIYVREGDTILEVGSRDINGSYREIFEGHDYTGIDRVAGKGVDHVVTTCTWMFGHQFDVVICGQVLEHDPRFWHTLAAIRGVTKPGGHVCIIVPRRWCEHREPVDCWRFLPDAMDVFGELLGMEVVKAETVGTDTIGIFRNV